MRSTIVSRYRNDEGLNADAAHRWVRHGPSTPSRPPADLVEPSEVDRRLANRNLRTALIAGAIALVVFALSFVVGLVY